MRIKFIFCAVCIVQFCFAQNTNVINKMEVDKGGLVSSVDTVKTISAKISDNNLKKIDSLWLADLYKNIEVDSVFLSPIKLDSIPTQFSLKEELPTDTLKARLKVLDSKTPFHIAYNPVLERVIKSYLKYRKKYYPRMLARAAYYFPLFEEELAKYDLPLEIKYLAVVESALKPTAKSPVGARGLWQFMYNTGKIYNLNVNSYVDERQDPIKATKAACQFLEKLYHMYQDWDLALAAYNSGPGNVNKAIRRSGNHLNYWNIRPYLPRETAGYLPAFYATMYIFEYAKQHGIEKGMPIIHSFETDSIQVKRALTFEQIHNKLGTDIAFLEFLNPAYKLNIVPFVKDKKYSLVLPMQDAISFVEKEEEIYAYAIAQDSIREKPLPKLFETPQRIRYKVKSGDYLGLIAKRYGVYVKDIVRWNRLRSNSLQIGQRLIIYPKRRGYTAVEKKKINKTIVPKLGEKKVHQVVKGDSLWNIAKKYGVTVVAIKSWNSLWKKNHLELGQKLAIYKM